MRKLRADEKRIIRQCACDSAGYAKVEICASTKVSLTKDYGAHMNYWFVTDDPDFSDTDLFDNSFTWDETKVEFTADGRCAIDFYVYAPIGGRYSDTNKELQTNVTAYWHDSKLVAVEGTCNGIMWRDESVSLPSYLENIKR